eukprot:TRINITY_DN22140_c0_g1_i3.p1 TRINITY_DN22140_c0_g1~~TRINITY_DN22140_c0_g1_i3.p1  ORF type:complete len:386 (-),score=53.16 TRINITY_DN22140_c0_g1_i3:373-1395(-)
MAPKESCGGVCGGGGSIACGRFSFVHGLKGPCISVDVEAASSLVALNYACSNLSRIGKFEPIPFALCSAWSLQLNPAPFIHGSAAGLLSPKGRTFTFDASASGYVRGDCVISIVLKAMTDIVDDQEVLCEDSNCENALAQLAGSATNQSGRRAHFTAPDSGSLQDVMWEALRQADLSPLDIDATEVAADGKILGDAVEAAASAKTFRPQGMIHVAETSPLNITASKSSVGHQIEAMGLSQVLKVALGARIGASPPTTHLRILNPYVDLDICERNAIISGEGLNFHLNSTYTGVTNRSIAGTNCHIIMFAEVSPEICGNSELEDEASAAEKVLRTWPPAGA